MLDRQAKSFDQTDNVWRKKKEVLHQYIYVEYETANVTMRTLTVQVTRLCEKNMVRGAAQMDVLFLLLLQQMVQCHKHVSTSF
jgi:translation elongation factor EF-Tu-like GTPase